MSDEHTPQSEAVLTEIRAAEQRGELPSSEEIARVLTGLQIRGLSDSFLSRYQLARQAGLGFDGDRDYYSVLGYDRTITTKQYRDEYARGGIAKRIVEAYPKATWRRGVEIYEDEDPNVETQFEREWNELNERLKIWSVLQRADILAGLSTFAVILIGAPGELDQELPKGSPGDVKYLQPYCGGGSALNSRVQAVAIDADATVYEYDTDHQSERFGEPLTYLLKRTDFTSPAFQKPVHWSRIIHVAEGCLDDNVHGQPTLQDVWNLLQDLMKVTGGGAEAFWLRANQGLHLDIDKDMSLEATKNTIEALREQAEQYKHQITRWLRTRGVKATTLGSDVANFGPSAESILQQIAGTKGIPMRILLGSEEGKLASDQDEGNFDSQVQDRRTNYAAPLIVRRLIDRLIAYGYLTKPQKYEVGWAARPLTEGEKADGALKWAQVNAVAGEYIYTPAEIREHWTDLEPLTFEERLKIAKEKAELAAAAMPPQPEPVPGEEPAGDEQLPQFARAAEFDPNQPRDDDGRWTGGSEQQLTGDERKRADEKLVSAYHKNQERVKREYPNWDIDHPPQKMSADSKALVDAIQKEVPGSYPHVGDHPDNELIAKKGSLRVVDPEQHVDFVKMQRNQCHKNSATLYAKNPHKYDIVTGQYAGDDDGVWRSHTWLVDKQSGRLVETTGNKATHYFGYQIRDEAEAKRFVFSEVGEKGLARLERELRKKK